MVTEGNTIKSEAEEDQVETRKWWQSQAPLLLHSSSTLESHQVTIQDMATKLRLGDNEVLRTEKKFKVFMENYEKRYSAREEYLRRLGIFAHNLVRAVEHQALDPTAVHGVTQFSDLTQDEFPISVF